MALDLSGLSQEEQLSKAAAYAGVPASVFTGMWKTESAMGTQMRSPAGAMGHFGLMPATKAAIEKRLGHSIDPDDFTQSLTAASMILRENIGRFGNLTDALKAYNAGWDKSTWDNPETNAYPGKVLEGVDQSQTGSVHLSYTAKMPAPPAEVAFNSTPADFRSRSERLVSGSTPKEYVPKIAQGAMAATGIDSALNSLMSGASVQSAASAAFEAHDDNSPIPLATQQYSQGNPDEGYFAQDNSWERNLEQQKLLQEQVANHKTPGVFDKLAASFNLNTATAGIAHYLGAPEREFDPSFSTADPKVMQSIFDFAHDAEDVDKLMDSGSQAELERNMASITENRQEQQTIADGSSMWGQMGYGVLGSALDPVGWGAGLGVGKALQMVGVGSRAAFLAGKLGRGVAYAQLEGAAGNLAVEGIMQATGEHHGSSDLLWAAGMGLAFGTALSAPLGIREAGLTNTIKATQEANNQIAASIKAAAVADATQLRQDAIGILGPNAREDQIAALMRSMDLNRKQKAMEAITADAPEADQVLPRISREDFDNLQAAWNGTNTSLPKTIPGARLTTTAEINAMAQKYNLDSTIPDPATRYLAAEAYARAEEWVKNNPIDTDRMRTLLRAGGMESTGASMMLEDNPLSKMLGGVLLESSTGATARRMTASIVANSREKIFMEDTMRQYDNLYSAWSARQGGSKFSDWLHNNRRYREFDKRVYAERDRRFMGKASQEADPEVLRAADLLDEAFERPRKEMIAARTLGSERLSKSPVRGYTNRVWAYGLIRGLDSAGFRAMQRAVKEQFIRLSGYDEKFADRFAKEYTVTARKHGMAGYDVPVNLWEAGNSALVRDALKASGAKDMEIDKLLGKFSRGGASFTKGRIDLDLTQTYTDDSGKEFQLLDLMNTDNMSLLRNYAKRSAGEIALARNGIMGEPGLKLVEQALMAGIGKEKMTDAGLRAFRQVSAEFLGRPFGNTNATLTNIRSLSSAIRLQGSVWNQLGDTLNSFIALGYQGVLGQVKSFPRLFKDVRKIAKGEKVDSMLNSVEFYTGDIGMESYLMQSLYDVDEGITVYGREAVGVFSRAVRAASNGIRILNGHRALTAVQTRGTAEQIVLKALRYIRDGVEDKALNDMGITPEISKAMKKELGNIVKWDKDGRVSFIDLTRAKDQNAAAAFAIAVKRGASQIVQEAYIGETGKWMHSDWLKLMFQFRAYSLVAHEKQWARGMAVHGKSKILPAMLGMMSMAAPVYMARTAFTAATKPADQREKYLDNNMNLLAISRGTMNYVGPWGILPDIMDLPLSFTPISTAPRGASSQGFVGSTVFPAAGVLNQGFKAAHNPSATEVMKLVPGASIPQLAWLTFMLAGGLDEGTEGVTDKAGL